MRNAKRSLVLPLSIVALLVGGALAKADTLPLSLTFDSPFQYAVAGETLTFDVNIVDTNATDTINLGGDTINLDPSLITDDGSTSPTGGFWNNAPYTLDPGQSSGDFELFTVYIPAGTQLGLYSGTFDITGYPDGDIAGNVGEASFDVNVVATPEPGTLLLLGTGLLGLALLAGRRFSPKHPL